MEGGSIIFWLIAAAAVAWLLRRLLRRRRAALRGRFIADYRFHRAIREKVAKRHPHLSAADLDLLFDGLRDYFTFCARAGRRMVSMPSQGVDDVWHEFILFTRTYRTFCDQAFGRFLHHTPVEAMRSPTLAEAGIRRAWRLACTHEGIDPRKPDRLPLLFAIDSRLAIPGGFHYALDCSKPGFAGAGDSYCASHIGCSSGCGGDSASDSFGDGGGDGGGGGCGGGCGGD